MSLSATLARPRPTLLDAIRSERSSPRTSLVQCSLQRHLSPFWRLHPAVHASFKYQADWAHWLLQQIQRARWVLRRGMSTGWARLRWTWWQFNYTSDSKIRMFVFLRFARAWCGLIWGVFLRRRCLLEVMLVILWYRPTQLWMLSLDGEMKMLAGLSTKMEFILGSFLLYSSSLQSNKPPQKVELR